MIAGADEAGCGTLIGELVAAAVLLPDGFDATGVKDSKKLSPKKREALCARIRAHAHVGVGVVTLEELNAASFGELRKVVFERAVKDLLRQITPAKIIIDGSGFFDGVDDIPFECVVKADDKYACVSAASIVAKTVRDGLVAQLCEEAPEDAAKYDWLQNKGYPTKRHRDAIRQHGITRFHRIKFRPCMASSIAN